MRIEAERGKEATSPIAIDLQNAELPAALASLANGLRREREWIRELVDELMLSGQMDSNLYEQEYGPRVPAYIIAMRGVKAAMEYDASSLRLTGPAGALDRVYSALMRDVSRGVNSAGGLEVTEQVVVDPDAAMFNLRFDSDIEYHQSMFGHVPGRPQTYVIDEQTIAATVPSPEEI